MKKKTRAYKEGFTDGQRRVYDNHFAEGSTRHADYDQGYREGMKV